MSRTKTKGGREAARSFSSFTIHNSPFTIHFKSPSRAKLK